MTKKSKSEPKPDDNKVVKLEITKPKASVFERFRSRKPPTIGGVGELLQPLPLLKVSDANDFVRLSPSPEHWSPELCFVSVPVHGEKKDLMHVIDEEIAVANLPSKKIRRFRLALASKPYDVFFLAIIPTTNMDNSWNSSLVSACEQAKTNWVQVTSRKAEGKETYKIDFAQDADAFPDPKWPGDMEKLVEITFNGCMIEDANHPALLRLTGRKQNLK